MDKGKARLSLLCCCWLGYGEENAWTEEYQMAIAGSLAGCGKAIVMQNKGCHLDAFGFEL